MLPNVWQHWQVSPQKTEKHLPPLRVTQGWSTELPVIRECFFPINCLYTCGGCSAPVSFEHHSDLIKTRLLWSRSTVSYSMFFLSEGLCWKLHPRRESAGGKQPSWQQDVSLSAAEGGWPLLEQAGCDWRGCIQVEDRKTMHPVDEDCGRTRLWAHFSCSV